MICWYSFFIDAYRYSSNYLLIAVTITIASVLCVWVYDRPNLYKLIFKKSKNAHLVDEVQQTNDIISEEDDPEIWPIRHDIKQQLMEKMSIELTKEQMELEKEVESKQLETIFKLLQEQEDELQVSSMEQLREQMKLYRK